MRLKYTFTLILALFLFLSSSTVDDFIANQTGIIDLENLFNYSDQFIPKKAILNFSRQNPITDEGATLGRVLFYDKKLSLNNSIACASCHQQENAFGDSRKVSIGFDGRPTARHAMRLINLGFSFDERRFWDKRTETLERTVTEPFQNEIEMGFSGTEGQPNFDSLLTKMKDLAYYKPLFTKAFGDEEITEERIGKALAQFIRSIMSFDAKFDEGFEETQNEIEPFSNFTDEENEGKRLFFTFPPRGDDPQTDRTGAFCGVCHKVPGFAILHIAGSNGVVGVAGDSLARDFSVFRSPAIRNLVRPDGSSVGPFMHDGSLPTLEAVVDHYNDIPPIPDHPRFGSLLFPNSDGSVTLKLTDDHKKALVAFLKTLTGEDVFTNPKWSNPFDENGNIEVRMAGECTTITTELALSICAGESYEGFTESGVYTNTFVANNGCDSVRTIQLDVLPLEQETISQTICFGESFLGYETSGVYEERVLSTTGCDKIRRIELTVLPMEEEMISQTICAGESYLGYETSGVYEDMVPSETGCDKIRRIELTVLPLEEEAVSQTICAGESYLGYEASGVYEDKIPTVEGCDQLRILTLTVLEETAPECLNTATIDQLTEASIYAFPNPFTSDIYVANIPDGLYELTMTDYVGRSVQKGQVQLSINTPISTNNLPTGLYIFQLKQVKNGQDYVFRILKQTAR